MFFTDKDALVVQNLKSILPIREFNSSLEQHNLHEGVICTVVKQQRWTHLSFRVSHVFIT